MTQQTPYLRAVWMTPSHHKPVAAAGSDNEKVNATLATSEIGK